ncbi:WhiB family transcriptional regulator [Luteimicrobium sp. NPDC057192]|uniref:WhiB family transcriptional regulator n=1 Tax=Luteimicrobium sp. NPDC057192 TaxID=3346042 RepID=UPI003635A004
MTTNLRPQTLTRPSSASTSTGLEPGERWDERAACKDWPTEMFFPEGRVPTSWYDPARALCDACPVWETCLNAAMREETGNYRFGMRGGLTPKQRQALVTGTITFGDDASEVAA